ncbi:MAG: cation diffusion facilitator family transporter [Alphaproteobacteria bacterium]
MHKLAFIHNLEKDQILKLSGGASIFVSLTLTLIKTAACFFTGSISLMSSLLDSMMDLLSSSINFTAILYALSPPDEEHRFGHGKAEDVAAFAQSIFIFGSAIFIAFRAIKSLITLPPLENETVGILVMSISLVLTITLVLFQRFVIRKTNSAIVQADALHYLTDILTNAAVLIVLFLAHFWKQLAILDAILGLFIALYVAHAAWEIFDKAFGNLMDREMSEEIRVEIINIVLSHSKVKGLHDLRTRAAGNKPIIQFHLELDPTLSLFDAHTIGDEVEDLILETYPDAEVLLHLDPENATVHPILSEQVKKI